jgi:hypothetical protein
MTGHPYGIAHLPVIIHPGEAAHLAGGTTLMRNEALKSGVAFVGISLQEIWADGTTRMR